MLHTKFSGKYRSTGSTEKKVYEGFSPYMAYGGHLGHVTSIMFINFHFLVPESLHTKFG